MSQIDDIEKANREGRFMAKHDRCPQCGSSSNGGSIGSTLLAGIFNEEVGRNLHHCFCLRCGWSGYEDRLIPSHEWESLGRQQQTNPWAASRA